MIKSIFSAEYKKIIKQLKNARLEAGLTQEEVARKLNVNRSYISKIEIGERRLDVLELKKFAKIYNKEINYFYK